MIIGVGIDIVAINRIKKIFDKFGKRFLLKFYCNSEIDCANNFLKSQNSHKLYSFLAKRFSAKEAFAKASGIGLGRLIDFRDIEISNDQLGKPQIKILNDKTESLKKFYRCKEFAIHLSLSDEKDLACASVILEKIN